MSGKIREHGIRQCGLTATRKRKKRSLAANKWIIIAIFGLLLPGVSQAQVSTYLSSSYGFDRNPMGNYSKLSDQMHMNYLETGYNKDYDESNLTLRYVGSLVLFNRFLDRNYYEHNALAGYFMKFEKEVNSSDEETGDSVAQAPPAIEDSTASYLDFTAGAGARHDKNAFKEFDNLGAGLAASYKFMLTDGISMRLTNSFGSRSYTYLQELSNLTDFLTVQLINKFNGKQRYGLNLSAGIKYYTQSVFDTTKFETRRTFVTKSQGKGKLGSKLITTSGKNILLEPQKNGTTQLTAAAFYGQSWGTGSLSGDVLYRYNPNTQTRYLARLTNSGINEDLYNDFFSYQGYEAALKFEQSIFFSLRLSSEYSFSHKNFEAPAMDVQGVETGKKRQDMTSSAGMTISRYFNISQSFGIDVSFSAGLLRNQSNDDYNDYSSFSYSSGIGIAF